MEHTKYAKLLRIAAPLGALLLAVFRVVTLKTALDEDGLLPLGSPILPLTVLLCAAVGCCLWLLCLRLNRLPGRENCFSDGAVPLLLRLAAAIAVFFGALLPLLERQTEPDKAELAIHWAGVASGLALTWLAAAPASYRKSWSFWLRLLPALYSVAALILRFREWSHDPLVIHFAPLLLCWTCCMVEMMLLSGYSLGAGHRRSGVLFGLGAGVFACMALPDQFLGQSSGLSELLSTMGLALWCAAAGFDLLRSRVQTEQPAPKPEPEAAPAPEAQALPEEKSE